MRSNAGMANRQGDVNLRFAQVSVPDRTLVWLRWAANTHSLLAHAMEDRPNSVPDTPSNLYCDVDSAVKGGRRPVDKGPDTNRESNIERLITRRTLRLADARENLKDRLHSYIELRSVEECNPTKHMAYFTFAD